MSKNVTMRDIAKKLNISAVSVSKALSGKDGVSDNMRELITKTALEMGYEYASVEAAKAPRYNIGVMVAQTFFSDNAFYSKLFQNLAIEFGKKNHSCTLEILSMKDEKEGNLPIGLSLKQVDGLIVLGPIGEQCVKKVLRLDFPCVFVDNYTPELDADCVVGDNMYGAHVLTNYLIEKGHRNITYIGDINASHSIMDRYLGYVKALLQHKLPIESDGFLQDRDSNGFLKPIDLPKQLPDAFVCNCDEVAYHLIEQLKDKGIRVPEQVSVVGFDDYIYATLSNPKLTTFRVNMEEMSRAAVEIMEEKFMNPYKPVLRRVVSGELIIRDSVRE